MATTRHGGAAEGFGPSASDATRVMAEFGVDYPQVERDHAISHALAAIASLELGSDLTFIGGTALSRTLLTDLRLSEDIDLVTHRPRGDVAQMITTTIERRLARSHGMVSWPVPLIGRTGSQPATVRLGDRISVQLQLLTDVGHPPWPVEARSLEQRYSDAPAAELFVLTPAAFAAAKAAAWMDRQAVRDLYDLWALGELGHITDEATKLFRRYGPTGRDPRPEVFTGKAPTDAEWQAALRHQGRVRIDPAGAARAVADQWERVT